MTVNSCASATASMAAPKPHACPVSLSWRHAADFIGAARQALDKLGVPWEPTDAQIAYNAGRSTQVPINPAVRLRKSRFVRRLKYQDTELRLER